MNQTLTVFIVSIFLYSCSPLNHFKDRKGKDEVLTDNNYKLLDGKYLNSSIESYYKIGTHLSNDKIYRAKDSTVQFHPLDNKTIRLDFYHTDSITSSITVKGKYKHGYFKINKYPINFIAGPLLWAIGNDINYIGLTKSNNLVLLNYSVGALFIVILPISIAGDQGEPEFRREN